MDPLPPRPGLRGAADLTSFEFMLQNVAPSAKRFNRAGQGNRCTSRYEIYNSTTRPFGKSYRDMVRTTPSDERPGNPSPTDTCESSAESSHSAYVTACCSEVETTVQVAGFTGGERGAALMTTIGEDDAVTEARNYDVRDAGADRAEVIDGTLKSAELVRRADEKRLMYAMPATSSWNRYDEEQLTYEPAVDELVRREVVTRSRSLFDLQEEEPAAETAPAFRRPAAPRPKLAKAASEDRLCETNAAASAVAETAAAAAPKKYSSAVNLTLAVRNERAPESGRRGGVKYKSQTDLRAEAPPKPLERPKSVDFLAAGGGRSHAEALRKHFYYNPLKQTKRLNDHELPDPDKVLSTRQLFQKELKIPLPPHMNDRNPKTGPRPTQEVRVVPPETRSSLKKCASADLGTAVHNRWTDSGSVSSGVGSEGSFDTDHTSSETNGGLLHRYGRACVLSCRGIGIFSASQNDVVESRIRVFFLFFFFSSRFRLANSTRLERARASTVTRATGVVTAITLARPADRTALWHGCCRYNG